MNVEALKDALLSMAAWSEAVVALLIEKGVFTREEHSNAFAKAEAKIDQLFAAETERTK